MLAFIEKGKLTCSKIEWDNHWSGYTGQVEIKKYKKTRTNEQNKLYWDYITKICDETGDNVGDMHEYLKNTLLPPRITTVMGKEIKLPPTTTKLNTKEFTEYIEKIIALTGYNLPYEHN